MEGQTINIRPFIGAKHFEISKAFYKDLGFQEVALSTDMSLFKTGELAFYLQDAYVKEWIENTMIFIEVKNTQAYYEWLVSLNLAGKYKGVKLTPIRIEHWGKECFLHDPSGVLWHFGEFFDLNK